MGATASRDNVPTAPGTTGDGLSWCFDGYDPSAEKLRESLCTLANGYLALRGAWPESRADGVHYPGTYVAGCYDRLTSRIAGRQVENEDLVNLPQALALRFGAHDGADGVTDWIGPGSADVVCHRVVLDTANGVLRRRTTYRDRRGRRVTVDQTRLVSMEHPHVAAMRTVLTAHGWSGELDVESAIDGCVTNAGVDRYLNLEGRHLAEVRVTRPGPDTVSLDCRTRGTGTRIAMRSRTVCPAQVLRPRCGAPASRAARTVRFATAPERPVTVDTTVVVFTGRDPAVSDPAREAAEALAGAPPFDDLLGGHRAAWRRLWQRAALHVPGEAGHLLRLHVFHVLQTLSPHTADLDVGVPARGLHGEAYRGHVFWDELFVLPYFNLHFPDVSRGLVEYRCRRLGPALANARLVGRSGALYPWQSASDGREQTQRLHLNPRSGRWGADHSRLQHHVNSAVAHGIVQYCEATGDTAFLQDRGAEVLVQIARFWADSADYDKASDRYHVRGVVGPDEFHDRYPGASEAGIDDNAYTNVTAAWVLATVLRIVDDLPPPCRQDVLERTDVTRGDLDLWDDVSRRLSVPFHDGVIGQFAGFHDLLALDWEDYRARYGDIRRLDRILEAEGDDVNRYQVCKQADVLMLGYLFSFTELRRMLRRLGYELDEATWRRTVRHYLARTSHGSTLSRLVHGWVLTRIRPDEAWENVQEALLGDVADIHAGTTGEGVHLGAMAGTLDLVQRCLPGLRMRDGVLVLDPVPLPALSSYGFSIRYRGHWGVTFRMQHGALTVTVPASDRSPIDLDLPDRPVSLGPGETSRLLLPG